MLEKIKSLIGSLRFWIVTLTLIISELQLINVAGDISNVNLADAIDYVKIYLIAVATIGTVDKTSIAIGKAIAK